MTPFVPVVVFCAILISIMYVLADRVPRHWAEVSPEWKRRSAALDLKNWDSHPFWLEYDRR